MRGTSRSASKGTSSSWRKRILFEGRTAKVSPQSLALLDEVAELLREHAKLRIQIEGYTDSHGNAQENNKLSVARATSVRTYLVGKGVAAERLEAHGYGAEKPIDSNTTARGRENNRRIELVIATEGTK